MVNFQNHPKSSINATKHGNDVVVLLSKKLQKKQCLTKREVDHIIVTHIESILTLNST